MIRASVVLFSAIFLGLLGVTTSVRADLSPYASYTVPGLSGSIQQFDLADVDGDGSAEVLASDGRNIVLYSSASAQTLFDFNLDSILAGLSVEDCQLDLLAASSLLADVTCDSLVDATLLVAIPCIPTNPYEDGFDTRFLVVFVDDAAGGNQPVIALDWENESRLGIGMLKAIDFDNDGCNNLVLSIDSSEFSEWYDIMWARDYSYGKTVVYHSFPDSTLHTEACILQDIQLLKAAGPRVFLAPEAFSTWEDPLTLGPWVQEGTRLRLLDSTGATLFAIGMPGDGLCTWTHDYMFRRYLSPISTGDLDGDSATVEILASYSWAYACDTWVTYQEPQSSGQQLVLFRYLEPDSLALIWSTDPGDAGYDLFLIHPDYTGQFFAVTGGILVRFDATNGSILQRYHALPEGVKYWVYPYGDGQPYLAVVNSDSVTYYSFDAVTDVQTDPSVTLPTTFTLGEPYPNPFNPTVTIPLTVDQKGHLRVEVFNPLGQKVAVLHDAVASPGETTLSWDASSFGSGVYLVKATLGNETRTVKAVLVK